MKHTSILVFLIAMAIVFMSMFTPQALAALDHDMGNQSTYLTEFPEAYNTTVVESPITMKWSHPMPDTLYRVAPGYSVMCPKGKRQFDSGQTIRPDVDMPMEKVQEHMRSGYVEEVNTSGIVLAREVPPIAHTAKWSYSPDDLKKKSLRALNAMVAEQDPKGPSFSDKTEAINHLSQNYKPTR